MYSRTFTAFVFALLILSGCSKDKNTDEKNQKTEIINLNTQISSLQTQLNKLQEQVNADQFFKQQEEFAVFTPSDKSYQLIRSNVGFFLISLENISKYANGYKITFLIGNPNLITFNGIKTTIQWGETFSPDKNFIDWNKSLKLKTIEIGESLLPGIWNKVTVILSPTEAKETGFIRIGLQGNEVLLSRDFRKNN